MDDIVLQSIININKSQAIKEARNVASAMEKQVKNIHGEVNLKTNGAEKKLGKITNNASEFSKSLDASTARVFAFGASTLVLNGVTQAFKNIVSATIEVEKNMIELGTLFDGTTKQLKEFQSGIFQIAKNTGQSLQVTSEGAKELARQGLTAEETMTRLNAAMVLTRRTGLDATRSVETLTAVMNGFKSAGLSAEQIVNKIANVDKAFAVSGKDLSEAFTRAGSSAEDAGISIDQLLGIVTAVQQTTSRGGAVIGNALKSVFTRISRGSTIDDLRELGVQIDASQNGEQKLIALSNALESISDPTIISKIKELAGGVFQINIVSAMLKDLGSDSSIYAEATKKSLSTLNEAFDDNATMNESLNAQLNALKISASELAVVFGEMSITPLLKEGSKILSGLLESLSGTGTDMGSTLVTGMANFIKGPGTALLISGFIVIASKVAEFAAKGFQEVLKMFSTAGERKHLEEGIDALLKSQNTTLEKLLAGATSQEEKETRILNLIKEQVRNKKAYNAELALASKGAFKQGYSFNDNGGGFNQSSKKILTRKASSYKNITAAKGYLPDAIQKESRDISNNVGGAKGAKPIIIDDFNFGNGKIGTIVANSKEKIVRNFDGSGGDAVLNPDMMKKNVGKQLSSGFIPNFSRMSDNVKKGSTVGSLKLRGELLNRLQKDLGKLSKGVLTTSEVLKVWGGEVKKSKGSLTNLNKIVESANNNSERNRKISDLNQRRKTGLDGSGIGSFALPEKRMKTKIDRSKLSLWTNRENTLNVPNKSFVGSDAMGTAQTQAAMLREKNYKPSRFEGMGGKLNKRFGAGSMGSFGISMAASMGQGLLGNMQADRVAKGKGKSTGLSVGSSALQGVALGSILGPWGMAIGGTIGAIKGLHNSMNDISSGINQLELVNDLESLSKSTVAIKEVFDSMKDKGFSDKTSTGELFSDEGFLKAVSQLSDEAVDKISKATNVKEARGILEAEQQKINNIAPLLNGIMEASSGDKTGEEIKKIFKGGISKDVVEGLFKGKDLKSIIGNSGGDYEGIGYLEQMPYDVQKELWDTGADPKEVMARLNEVIGEMVVTLSKAEDNAEKLRKTVETRNGLFGRLTNGLNSAFNQKIPKIISDINNGKDANDQDVRAFNNFDSESNSKMRKQVGESSSRRISNARKKMDLSKSLLMASYGGGDDSFYGKRVKGKIDSQFFGAESKINQQEFNQKAISSIPDFRSFESGIKEMELLFNNEKLKTFSGATMKAMGKIQEEVYKSTDNKRAAEELKNPNLKSQSKIIGDLTGDAVRPYLNDLFGYGSSKSSNPLSIFNTSSGKDGMFSDSAQKDSFMEKNKLGLKQTTSKSEYEEFAKKYDALVKNINDLSPEETARRLVETQKFFNSEIDKFKGVEMSDELRNGIEAWDQAIQDAANQAKKQIIDRIEQAGRNLENSSNNTQSLVSNYRTLDSKVDPDNKFFSSIAKAKANVEAGNTKSSGYKSGGASFDLLKLMNPDIQKGIDFRVNKMGNSKEDATRVIKENWSNLIKQGDKSVKTDSNSLSGDTRNALTTKIQESISKIEGFATSGESPMITKLFSGMDSVMGKDGNIDPQKYVDQLGKGRQAVIDRQQELESSSKVRSLSGSEKEELGRLTLDKNLIERTLQEAANIFKLQAEENAGKPITGDGKELTGDKKGFNINAGNNSFSFQSEALVGAITVQLSQDSGEFADTILGEAKKALDKVNEDLKIKLETALSGIPAQVSEIVRKKMEEKGLGSN